MTVPFTDCSGAFEIVKEPDYERLVLALREEMAARHNSTQPSDPSEARGAATIKKIPQKLEWVVPKRE